MRGTALPVALWVGLGIAWTAGALRQPYKAYRKTVSSDGVRVRMGRGGKDPIPQVSCEELCEKIGRKLEKLKWDLKNDQKPENTPDKGHYQEINERIRGIENDLEKWERKGCQYRADGGRCPAVDEAKSVIQAARQHQKKQKASLKDNEGKKQVVDVVKLAAFLGISILAAAVFIELASASFVLRVAALAKALL